jgi:pyruvate/2-oxoglutarate dehydrogenase complex dihydrolipoamide acyltransferase (E2) component
MASEFKLPEIGEGVMEGEIVEWHVAEGDSVNPDQPLVSVLTDKATVEITADFEGTITSLGAEPGDMVDVGAPLLSYSGDAAEDDNKESKSDKKEEKAPANAGQASSSDSGSGDVIDFPLPEIGEGVMEGELVEWHVAEGDEVSDDQPIASVLTDKATVEITAPQEGVIESLLAEAGDILEVGAPIMKLKVASSGGESKSEESTSKSAEPEKKAEKKEKAPSKVSESSDAGEVDPKDNPSITAFGTPLATPAVRRFASQKGIDLSRVKGSGPKHRITREDVERVIAGGGQKANDSKSESKPAAAPQKPKPAKVDAVEGDRREKIRGLRKAIYNSMTISKSTIPHFTYVDEVEMDNLMALRTSVKEDAAEEGVKITYLPFIVKAVCLALKKFPIMNTSVDDEAGEIVYKNRYNVGIATATERGLTVPVLKDADKKPIMQVASEMNEIIDRARKLRSTTDDLADGTFTITSLGRLGGILATPIINHPQTSILGIHNMVERPVVRNGEIVIRNMMNISLSFDHRVIDGDVGATFAQEVKRYLENPGKIMLHMS